MTVKHNVKEILIEQQLLRRVRERGGICEKVTVVGTRGYFDRIVVLPDSRVIFVECKRPRGGKFSEHQKQRHTHYRALGVAVEIIWTVEDIDRLLNG